jgi:hypothetical protein
MSSLVTQPSLSSCTRVALSGARASRACMAADVRPLAAHSRYLPRITTVISMAHVSKKSCKHQQHAVSVAQGGQARVLTQWCKLQLHDSTSSNINISPGSSRCSELISSNSH